MLNQEVGRKIADRLSEGAGLSQMTPKLMREADVEREERIGGPGSCSEFEAGLAANAEACLQWSIAQAAQKLQCAEALAENYRLRVALAGLIGQIDLFCAANGEADFETGAAKRLLRRKTKC